MKNQVSYIMNPGSHITIAFADGKNVTTYSHESIFDELLEATKREDWIAAKELIFKPIQHVTEAVEQLSSDGSPIKIEHGVVYLDGTVIHNTIADRIVSMKEEGFNIEPMKLFLINLMENPSFRAVEELYDFLEATQLPITDDGHFLAYKKIRSNYTDQHSGKMDNSVGAVVQMPRNRVNDDKDEVCSTGLHFCGRSYLSSFGGERTVAVKINPRDVVSIPTDYNNAKGRACRYVIWQELDIDESKMPTAEMEKKTVTVPVTKEKVIIQSTNPADESDVRTYASVEEASKSTGLRIEYINRVLDGDRMTTGGLLWSRIVEQNTVYDVELDETDDTDPSSSLDKFPNSDLDKRDYI